MRTRRYILIFIVAFLMFLVGVVAVKVWSLIPVIGNRSQSNPPRCVQPGPPLSVQIISTEDTAFTPLGTFNAKVPMDMIIVRNVSNKTIRGYALAYDGLGGYGQTVQAFDDDVLQPGESRKIPLWGSDENTRFRVEFVYFADGSTWGPNETRSEGYFRE